ncbi:MAG: lipoprotein-releasing ABC transporter permease subunit, partial [Gammaproteobacteria bacterium]|nr:lipoprotein-releasing ABC transporter permease subunit [Gammaproteobacteria bacterium]
MPLVSFIGLRYTRSARGNRFASMNSMISMIGIVLGVAALITVLSVMNGFQKELRGRILAVASHATITGNNRPLRNWEALSKRVQAYEPVASVAPYLLGQAMLSAHSVASGTLIRGILPQHEARVADFEGHFIVGGLGELKAGEFGILVGSELAWKLGLEYGSKVTLLSPQGQVSPAGLLPRLKRFTVVGIFEMGMFEYDSGLVFVHMDDAARLFKSHEEVTGLRLRLKDIDLGPQVRVELGRDLGKEYRVRDWTLEHANFFRALRIEKTVMFIILLLIVAVAAFNIVSTLVMVVTDKRADIAILRTLGMTPPRIMGIFMVQGAIIGIVGTLLGGGL